MAEQRGPRVHPIDVVKHFSFCRGSAIQHLWLAGSEGDLVSDLRKAIDYIEQEIADIEDAQEITISGSKFSFRGDDAEHAISPQEIADIGSNPARQSRGLPGHCPECALYGHVDAHPHLGCSDVGCSMGHL